MVRNRNNYYMQVKSLLVAFLLFLSLNLFAQPSGKPLSLEGAKGESLFKLNCVSCHAMNAKLVGPALQNVHQRRSEEWLLKWIKNNEKLRASGDKDAIAVYNENGKSAMNVFENLSDDQIEQISKLQINNYYFFMYLPKIELIKIYERIFNNRI